MCEQKQTENQLENYTVAVRVHCTRKIAEEMTDLIDDFAEDLIKHIDASTVLIDDNGNEIY